MTSQIYSAIYYRKSGFKCVLEESIHTPHLHQSLTCIKLPGRTKSNFKYIFVHNKQLAEKFPI